MRRRTNLNRSLQVLPLEDRTTPAVAFALSGNALTITGDTAANTVSLSADTGGFLQHNLGGVGGLATNLDLDSTTAGVQSKLVSALTGLSIDLGTATDTLNITGVATGLTLANTESLNFTLSAGEANGNVTFTNNALTVTNVPSGYLYGFSGVLNVQIFGGSGHNVLDASAWTGLGLALHGGAGNDVLKGGAAGDALNGNDGDDQLFARDGAQDVLNGGNGTDQAWFQSADVTSNCELWNPMPQTADNRSQKVKVLVVNYDPLVPSQGNKHLYEVFGWPKPQELAEGYEMSLERSSGGAVTFEVVEWRNINEIPVFENGYQYSPDEYYTNRLTNTNWQTGPGSTADVRKIFRDQAIVPMINAGIVDEVWFFGDHYFSIGGEAFMAGPGAFFINGPVYSDVPSVRPFACYGFSYERGVAEMLHNTGHRTENHGNRTWGGWNLANPTTNWDKFSANVTQSAGVAGSGTCHYPPNALSDYDYSNATVVQSWADDFLDYPQFTGVTSPVSNATWRANSNTTADDQRSYLEWYFHHMPRGAGVNADGRENNWYKYIYDYANYTQSGQALPLRISNLQADDLFNLGAADYTFRVAFSSPKHINVGSFDGQDVRVTGPGGFSQLAQFVGASDASDGPYRVATYRITAPGGSWDAGERGLYTMTLQAAQIGDDSGATLAEQKIGSFQIRSAAGQTLSADADTSLLLPLDGTTSGLAGEIPMSTVGSSFSTGVQGQGVQFASPGYLKYTTSGNVAASAGTVEFWLKPGWNSTDPGNPVFFGVGQPFTRSIQFQFDDWADEVKMMMWGDDPGTIPVETNWERNFTSHISWSSGQWHHLAITWDVPSRTMSMYVDGVQVSTRSDAPLLSAFSTTSFSIGADANGNQPAATQAFDEFRISSRARSGGEIAADYRTAISTVGLSIGTPSVALNRFDSLRLTANALAAFGGSVDVTRQVHWSSNNPAVSVSADGVVKGLAAGSATITATLDTFTANCTVTVTDVNRPAASLAPISDLIADSTAPLNFTVTYTDNTAVNATTIEKRDVWVHSSNGISRHANLVSVTPSGNGPTRVATYQITPPQGAWDERDNGLYIVESTAWQVGDTGNIYAPASVLGTFKVRISLPQAQPVQVHTGGVQRSRIGYVQVPFTETMTLAGGAFTLTGPGGVVPLAVDVSPSTPTQTIAKLTPSGLVNSSLPDGLYTLTGNARLITDSIGQRLDGDGDGLSGGNLIFLFHRLFGDADGNRTVDGTDFSAFGGAFGSNTTDSPFDFDNNDTIDGLDFAAFGSRFGVTL